MISFEDFTSAVGTCFSLSCGEERVQELARLVIAELEGDECGGSHPTYEYSETWESVVRRRGREDELVAWAATVRLLVPDA